MIPSSLSYSAFFFFVAASLVLTFRTFMFDHSFAQTMLWSGLGMFIFTHIYLANVLSIVHTMGRGKIVKIYREYKIKQQKYQYFKIHHFSYMFTRVPSLPSAFFFLLKKNNTNVNIWAMHWHFIRLTVTLLYLNVSVVRLLPGEPLFFLCGLTSCRQSVLSMLYKVFWKRKERQE